MRTLIFICSFLIATIAVAATDTYQFSNQEDQYRFAKLTQEFRCLVCQNQNLEDSNAPLAKDLRQQIATMINDGAGDQEIGNFLVKRYGEFVFYKPQVSPKTYFLWFGPLIILIISGVTMARSIRAHQKK